MATLDETIRQAVQAYLARTGMSERKLGAFAAGEPSLVPRLMAGGSTTLHTADALLPLHGRTAHRSAVRRRARGVPVRDRYRGTAIRGRGRPAIPRS